MKGLYNASLFGKKLFGSLSGRVIVYSAVFIICWTGGTVMRTIQLFNETYYNFGLVFYHNLISRLCPFFISLAFIFEEKLYVVYKCCKKGSTTTQPNSNAINENLMSETDRQEIQ